MQFNTSLMSATVMLTSARHSQLITAQQFVSWSLTSPFRTSQRKKVRSTTWLTHTNTDTQIKTTVILHILSMLYMEKVTWDSGRLGSAAEQWQLEETWWHCDSSWATPMSHSYRCLLELPKNDFVTNLHKPMTVDYLESLRLDRNNAYNY